MKSHISERTICLRERFSLEREDRLENIIVVEVSNDQVRAIGVKRKGDRYKMLGS